MSVFLNGISYYFFKERGNEIMYKLNKFKTIKHWFFILFLLNFQQFIFFQQKRGEKIASIIHKPYFLNHKFQNFHVL